MDAAMLRRAFIAAGLGLGLVVAPASAATPQGVSEAAEPVAFYVFSFNGTPVGEAADDVVRSALGYELEVDPAVEGEVTFSADGWYSGEALLKDFGAALLDQDIALMRTGSGAYALIPRANVPILLGRGGVLMTLDEPAVTAAPPAARQPSTVAVYGRDRWWEGAAGGLLLFLGGAAAGAVALAGGQTIYRRAQVRARLPAPVLRLTDQRRPLTRPVPIEADPELIIPSFDERVR